MDIRKLQRAIVDGLEDVKAHNIVVFNTEHLSPLFERVIVASGNSNRQTKALASSVREAVKSRGLPVLSTEGAENGEWIIVDCGAAVAHIMQPAIRDYYRLEEIWGGKSVKMKIDGEAGPATARPEPTKTAAGRPAASKRRTISKAAPNKVAAKKPGLARAGPAKKASPAKKTAATKAARPSHKAARKGPIRAR
jgi:ribosome-associated protein